MCKYMDVNMYIGIQILSRNILMGGREATHAAAEAQQSIREKKQFFWGIPSRKILDFAFQVPSIYLSDFTLKPTLE